MIWFLTSILGVSSLGLFVIYLQVKKLGKLSEINSNLEKKNKFLNSQLEREMELSDKRAAQIRSLLDTGKFSHIELP